MPSYCLKNEELRNKEEKLSTHNSLLLTFLYFDFIVITFARKSSNIIWRFAHLFVILHP